MHFGEQFKTWIKMVNMDQKEIMCCDRYNLSRIDIARGVHQGCSMSPILLTFVIEMVAIVIRSDRRI